MGTSLGDIFSGLTAAATGAEAGISNRRELERRAMQQLLAQRLQEAQIANYQSETRRRGEQTDIEREKLKRPTPGQLGRYKAHVNDDGSVDYIWEPAAGQAPPGAAPPTGQQPAPGQAPVVHSGARVRPKPTLPVVSTDKDGNVVLVDRKALTATPIPGAHKPLTAVERETKGAGRTVHDLIKQARALRRQSATAGQLPLGAAILRAPGRLPIVGEAAQGLTEPLAQQFMTQQQAAYQQKMDQLLHFASSVLPKGGRSLGLLKNLRASYTSPALAKNPQAAYQALDELDKFVTEVIGEDAPPSTGFQFKYHTPK